MTLTRSVLGSSLCWRASVPEGSTRKIPREWEYWLYQQKKTPKFDSWFLYHGRGFPWTDQHNPALSFLYEWRWALHHCCEFYETRYVISYMKPCESGSSLQPSNFPAKEQFTVKSIGTCLFRQICGVWLLCLYSDICTCLTGCKSSCTDHTSVGWLTHLFLQGWDLH